MSLDWHFGAAAALHSVVVVVEKRIVDCLVHSLVAAVVVVHRRNAWIQIDSVVVVVATFVVPPQPVAQPVFSSIPQLVVLPAFSAVVPPQQLAVLPPSVLATMLGVFAPLPSSVRPIFVPVSDDLPRRVVR